VRQVLGQVASLLLWRGFGREGSNERVFPRLSRVLLHCFGGSVAVVDTDLIEYILEGAKTLALLEFHGQTVLLQPEVNEARQDRSADGDRDLALHIPVR
jgi:hypothetical protein